MRIVVYCKIIAEYSKQMSESQSSSLETEVKVDWRRVLRSQKYYLQYLLLQIIRFPVQGRKTQKKEFHRVRIGREENR